MSRANSCMGSVPYWGHRGGDRCLSLQKPKEGTSRGWDHKVEKGVQAEGRKCWKVGVCFRCLASMKGEGKAAGHSQGSRKLGASSRMISEVSRETFSKRWRAPVRRGAVCHPSVAGNLWSLPKRSEKPVPILPYYRGENAFFKKQT